MRFQRKKVEVHYSLTRGSNSNKSSETHLGRAASPPHTAENGLSRCVC